MSEEVFKDTTTSEDRIKNPYFHIDPGFINHRECFSAIGSQQLVIFEQYRKQGDDHYSSLFNDHLLVDIVLNFAKRAKIQTLGETLQNPQIGTLFSSTETLEGNEDVYEEDRRVRNRVLLPYNYDKEVYLEFSTRHFLAETGQVEQSIRCSASVIGKIRTVSDVEIIIYPLIMGAPTFKHTQNEKISVSVDLAWYGYRWYEIYPEDIDEFSGCKVVEVVSDDEWMRYMGQIPEQEVKKRLAEILADPIVKDWGGELADHFSTIHLNGRATTAAFLLKGPTYFREMTPDILGARADQIYRLAQTPAQVLIVQHSHTIGSAVRATLRAFAVAPHNPRWYCLIEGKDTYRSTFAHIMLSFGNYESAQYP